MAPLPPAAPLPPPPHGPDMEGLFIFVRDGNLAALRNMIEHPNNKAYWDEPHGRF